MPTISMFYGVIIRMFFDDHNPPHIHAIYGKDKAIYNLDGEVLEGEIPNKKHKLVVAWIEIHKDELTANWELAHNDEPLFKIEPLK